MSNYQRVTVESSPIHGAIGATGAILHWIGCWQKASAAHIPERLGGHAAVAATSEPWRPPGPPGWSGLGDITRYFMVILYGFIYIYNIYIHTYIYMDNIWDFMDPYGGCQKSFFPDSPQSLSQSRSNRGTTVSNRGRVCSSLIRSYT